MSLKVEQENIMIALETDLTITTAGHESLVWINDRHGRQYSCTLDTPRTNLTSIDELSDHERAPCMDVNLLVGTERW